MQDDIYDVDKALEFVNRARATGIDDVPMNMAEGEVAFHRDDFERSLQCYQACPFLFFNIERSLEYMIVCGHLRLERELREFYEVLLARHEPPNYIAAIKLHFGAALSLIELYEEAIPYIEEAYEKGDRGYLVIKSLIDSYHGTSRTDKAIEVCRQTIPLVADHLKYPLLHDLAEFLMSQKRAEEAIDVLKQVYEMIPSPETAGSIGYLYNALEKHLESIPYLKEAFDAKPDQDLYNMLFMAYSRTDVNEATEFYKKYGEQFGDKEEQLLRNRIKELTEKEDWTALHNEVLNLIHAGKGDAENFSILGKCNYQLGDFHAAIKNFESALEVSTDKDRDCYLPLTLGILNGKIGDEATKEELFQKGEQHSGDNLNYHRGIAYQLLHEFDLAQGCFEKRFEEEREDLNNLIALLNAAYHTNQRENVPEVMELLIEHDIYTAFGGGTYIKFTWHAERNA